MAAGAVGAGALATGGVASLALGVDGNLARKAAGRQAATDWVTLGKSGVKVTRLAGIGHREHQREGTTRVGAGWVQQIGAACVRQWNSIF